MKIIKLYCKEIHGENGAFVETGNKTVTFTAEIPKNGVHIRKCFVVCNVGETDKYLDARFYARQYAMFCMCGNLFADKDYEIF